MIFAYVTFPTRASAKKASQMLLKKRLAGCANIFPIESAYWWKGKIAEEKEFVAVLKTEKRLYKELEAEVKKAHPYSVPFVGIIELEGVNPEYGKWLSSELKK